MQADVLVWLTLSRTERVGTWLIPELSVSVCFLIFTLALSQIQFI
jgi:hypothetical protein